MLAFVDWVCIDSFMDTTDTSLPASVLTAGITAETIGRYSRAELEAMHGKRGRKPPEYFTLFPERVRVAPTPRPKKLAEASMSAAGSYDADPLSARLRQASPAVRRLVANLLDVVDSSLNQPAQSQVEDVAPTNARVETLSSEPVHLQAVISDPVYADPEIEPELAEQA